MSTIVADDSLLVKELGQYGEPVEILKSNGELLGLFVPSRKNGQPRPRTSTLSPQEIERRKKNKAEGKTTRQVFEHLLSLATVEADREHLRKIIAEVEERDRCTGP